MYALPHTIRENKIDPAPKLTKKKKFWNQIDPKKQDEINKN